MNKHFEAFLTGCMLRGHTQVKLVPRIDDNGKVAFYAVGQCGPESSETFNAVVEGKHVRRIVDMPADTPVKDEEVDAFMNEGGALAEDEALDTEYEAALDDLTE